MSYYLDMCCVPEAAISKKNIFEWKEGIQLYDWGESREIIPFKTKLLYNQQETILKMHASVNAWEVMDLISDYFNTEKFSDGLGVLAETYHFLMDGITFKKFLAYLIKNGNPDFLEWHQENMQEVLEKMVPNKTYFYIIKYF